MYSPKTDTDLLMKVLCLFAVLAAALPFVVDATKEEEDGVFIHSEDWIGPGEVMTREDDDDFCFVRPWYNPKKLLKYKNGNLCGYWKTDYGHYHDRNLHRISVCCEKDSDDARDGNGDEEFECVSCGECITPQLVAQECCGIALNLDGMGRSGDFGGCPGDKLCCKCGDGVGSDSFACIPHGATCDESACPPKPTTKTTQTTTSLRSSSTTTDPTTTTTEPSTTTDPTTTTASFLGCRIPTPPVPEDYGGKVVNVNECAVNATTGEGQTIAASNTLIQLQNDISCAGDASFFLRIQGDNNTVDCGGFFVDNRGSVDDAFEFHGVNNVIQNCPGISNFDDDAIEVNEGNVLFVFNVSASDNRYGLYNDQAEVYVDGSKFNTNTFDGILAEGTSSTTSFKLVIKNTHIKNNLIGGVEMSGFGEACLEDNEIADNEDANIEIDEVFFGVPITVTLANMDLCISGNADIRDNTGGASTTLDNVQCGTVCGDFEDPCTSIDAIEYGCTPCTPPTTTTTVPNSTTTTNYRQ